jgi:membrane fusion protein, heavy metal efflux system
MRRTSIYFQLCRVKYLRIRKQINNHLKPLTMDKAIISFVIITALLSSCNNDVHNHANSEHEHPHGDETHTSVEIEPLAYTLYTEKTELFVEFKPLIVGKISKFAAHFTQLGGSFKAVTEGSVTVSLIGNKKQSPDRAQKPSSSGIFRLALSPGNSGIYQLVFDIQTKEFTDRIIIENITVYPDTKTALANQQEQTIEEELVYLKEQAWKIDFANMKVKRQPFTEIIKTTGQILPAHGDEATITAKSSGIITFGKNKKLNNYEKSKIDFERANGLLENNIISQKRFQETQLLYKNAQTTFTTIEKNYTAGGHKITSPIQGYIKNVMISEGEYVEIGQSIASVSQNLKLILKAEVPQKYFSRLNSISSANFVTAYDSKIYSTDSLNGKLISYGKSTVNNAYYIPVNFEINNNGEIIPGSFVEVLLKTNVIKEALVIPYSALIEEQGNYFAYVQTSGEGYQKRELKIGANDGMNVQVLAGIKKGDRVVIKGGYQIKLATMSGKMPAHGHEH